MRLARAGAGLLLVGLPVAACDLTDVTIADLSDIVVAEVYVTVADAADENAVRAFLHGSAPGAEPSSATYDDALVTLTDAGGSPHVLPLTVLDECVAKRPSNGTGSCFAASVSVAAAIRAGDRLSLEIALGDGRRLTGSTRVPGDFAVDAVGSACRIQPDALLPLVWSRSDSAWAYVSEALILGLPDALSGEGIDAPDTLSLTGLSISESDTTVVFPSEFGIFDRFDLDRDLAVRLQEGLPEGASADVAITAVDRNYVNWVRGGSFNPSGTVRVSSLVGAGSGLFGSALTRRFSIVSSADTATGPACSGP